MDILSPGDHKSRLINLAVLWQNARREGGKLVREAEAKAHSLDQAAEAAFVEAKHEAESALLLVRHDMDAGFVRVFHLTEVDPKDPPK
jgi:hypothetical protein